MNDTLKVLETRRSCRNFKPDMIPEETLEQIVRAGTYAPTGMGKQSPIILAVTNKELRDQLSEENRKEWIRSMEHRSFLWYLPIRQFQHMCTMVLL